MAERAGQTDLPAMPPDVLQKGAGLFGGLGPDYAGIRRSGRGREGADEITLFTDGRALIHGPMTPERARGWYTEVVGC